MPNQFSESRTSNNEEWQARSVPADLDVTGLARGCSDLSQDVGERSRDKNNGIFSFTSQSQQVQPISFVAQDVKNEGRSPH